MTTQTPAVSGPNHANLIPEPEDPAVVHAVDMGVELPAVTPDPNAAEVAQLLSLLRARLEGEEDLYPFVDRSWCVTYDVHDKIEPIRRKNVRYPWRDAARASLSHFIPWLRQKWERELFSVEKCLRGRFRAAWCDTVVRRNGDLPDCRVGGAYIFWDEQGQHIAHWDPARTDRECQAKRAIMDWAATIGPVMALPVLRSLAAVYLDGDQVDPNADGPEPPRVRKESAA